MTVAAVIEEGGADANTMFDIPPTLDRGGKTFHDATDHGGYRYRLCHAALQYQQIALV